MIIKTLIFIPLYFVPTVEPRDEMLPSEYFLSFLIIPRNFAKSVESTVEWVRSLLWTTGGFFPGLETEHPGKIPIFPELFFPCHHPDESKTIFLFIYKIVYNKWNNFAVLPSE